MIQVIQLIPMIPIKSSTVELWTEWTEKMEMPRTSGSNRIALTQRRRRSDR
jgi:hypothetical protein